MPKATRSPRTARSAQLDSSGTPPLPVKSEFRVRIDSVADIKSRWGISLRDYEIICSSFQDILKESGILGERIQGTTVQSAVNGAIDNILCNHRHRDLLGQIDSDMVYMDLRYLAAQLSRNYRRRIQRDKRRQTHTTENRLRLGPTGSFPGLTENGSRSSIVKVLDKAELAPSSPREAAGEQGGHNGSTTLATGKNFHLGTQLVVVRREGEEGARIYRLDDFCSAGSIDGASNLDNLQFDQFLTMLDGDFAYHPEKDILSYDCAGEGIILVSNEKIWKAALLDMSSQGQRHFGFRLRRKRTRSAPKRI